MLKMLLKLKLKLKKLLKMLKTLLKKLKLMQKMLLKKLLLLLAKLKKKKARNSFAIRIFLDSKKPAGLWSRGFFIAKIRNPLIFAPLPPNPYPSSTLELAR